MKHLLFAMALAAGLCAAEARADSVSASEPQTIDGQNFTFDFGPGLKTPSGDGKLVLHARGDYTLWNVYEFLTWDLDGLFGGVFKPGAGDVVTYYSTNDVEWEHEFTLDHGLLETALSDGELSLFIDLSGNVHADWGQPFFSAYIGYPVPEPMSLALLGLGAFGLVWRRRRRRAA